MKKRNYLFLILLLFHSYETVSQQHNVADFENLNLSNESYWDGSDLTGNEINSIFTSNFSSGDYTFSNYYDTTWGLASGYWSGGWSYSNMTDSTSSGSVNLYSSKAGGGHPIGGSNYAIGTNNSTIVMNNPQDLSINISNSTYAANSMRDGDSFAKKFTNADQDYFKLHIYGYSNGSILDSTEFYLADFTHADSSLDYIVNDWQYVELGPNLYDSVQFQLSSSDNGQWGMNTPAYFCIDNVGNYPLSIDDGNISAISAYPNPVKDFISFNNVEDINEYKVSIIDFYGKEVISNLVNPRTVDLSNLPSGQYIIKIVYGDKIKYDKVIKI